MMNREELLQAVEKQLCGNRFYSMLGRDQRTRIAARLVQCDERLLCNLVEWANATPLSDVWINDKYSVNAVMHIRRSEDFVSAFVALDDYAKNPNAEYAIWQRWG